MVTQWQPPQRLIWSGRSGGRFSEYPESYPTFELEARGEGVVLTFTHFPVLERFVPQNAMGWHTMLDLLTGTLRGEKLEDRSSYMRKNAGLYGVDLGNLAR